MESFAIFVSGIAIFVLIVTAIRRTQTMKAEQNRLLREFGFVSLKRVEPTLEERVRSLVPQHQKSIRLVNIHQLDRNDGKVYIFDLYTGGKNSSTYKSIAIISQYLNLSRFSLYPKINLGGIIGKALNKMIKYIVSRNLREIILDNNPEFMNKYQLFGNDRDSVKEIYSGDLPRRLLEKADLFYIQAEGDTVLFSRFNPETRQYYHYLNRKSLQSIIDDARMLVRTLQQQVLKDEKSLP
jgi:hypothetical protein